MTDKKPATTIDIFDIKPISDVEVAIKHPGTGKCVGLFINLRSVDHPEVQKITRAIRTKTNKLAMRGKPLTADEERTNAIEIITAAITGWRWGEGDDGVIGAAGGEQLQYTPDNVRKVLNVDSIRDQLDTELGDTAQFFR